MTDKVSVDDVETLINKGKDFHKLGKYDEAINYNDKALAIEPNSVRALNNKEQLLRT
jgi:hypothetical protein